MYNSRKIRKIIKIGRSWMVKIYLIAGEVSGDFIASKLMRALQNLYQADGKNIEFRGVGGGQMEEAGLSRSFFPIKQINFMGFMEIIPHLFKIMKLINQTALDIVQQKPDLLITIDSPGFTYRVAKKVRKLIPHLKMLHIVAPSVWAYRPSRALKYAKLYNYLFALLPFEPPCFQKLGLDCRYIGHPIIEQNFYEKKDQQQLRQELQLYSNHPAVNDIKVLSVTCGSRKGEILRHAAVFISALNIIAEQYPQLIAIFVLADPHHQYLIEKQLHNATFKYVFSTEQIKAFAASDLALAKSGTNTLEIAASNTPMVVAYKVNLVSYWIIKLLIKIPYISIINIIAGKIILPELIQFNCTKHKLANELVSLLVNKQKAAQQVTESNKILKELGFTSANSPSCLAATIIKSEYLAKLSL